MKRKFIRKYSKKLYNELLYCAKNHWQTDRVKFVQNKCDNWHGDEVPTDWYAYLILDNTIGVCFRHDYTEHFELVDFSMSALEVIEDLPDSCLDIKREYKLDYLLKKQLSE